MTAIPSRVRLSILDGKITYKMKRLLAIVFVFMLLAVGFVGLDPIFRVLGIDRESELPVNAGAGEELEVSSVDGGLEDPLLASAGFKLEEHQGAVDVSDQLEAETISESTVLNVTGEVSSFYFIRSSVILGEMGATDRERELLRAATTAVMAELELGAIVLDADVVSERGFPVVVFAKDELDLTGRVKVVFEALVREPVGVLETAKSAGVE